MKHTTGGACNFQAAANELARMVRAQTMEWCDRRQPIETAPKDGTNILLHLHPEIVKRCGYQMEICHYEKRPLLGETWTAQNGGFSIDIDCATHWEPLPLR